MYKSFLIFSLFLISSCNYHKPNDIDANKVKIPEEKFIEIMTSLHLGEGVYNSALYKSKYFGEGKIALSDSIIASYGYKRSDFDSTLSAYSANPEKLDEVYYKVIKKLRKMEENITKKNKPH